MMKRSLISVLSLLMLVLCIPALAESTDWNYDANYAILRGYDGAGGDVVVPAEIDGFTVDVIGINVFKGDTITSLTLPETVLHWSFIWWALPTAIFALSQRITSKSMAHTQSKIFRRCLQPSNPTWSGFLPNVQKPTATP